MTTKDKLAALRAIEEVHAVKHSPSDIFKSSANDCACAFGIVWRMVNEAPTKPTKPGYLR